MKVRVLFFGKLRELATERAKEIELAEGATVGDLLGYYIRTIPEIGRYSGSLATSVNEQYAPKETVLHEGDEVALLPPVSGGSDAVQVAGKPHRALLVTEPIDAAQIVESVKAPADGAVVVFDGVVRDQSRGKRTLYLEYEAYAPMAQQQLESLTTQVVERFAIREARIVHRVGKIEIGQTSVLIVVASAHRAAAFDACRWMIDTLKKTVPIWKKEYFDDGAVWADGDPFPPEVTGSRSTVEHGGAVNRATGE